MKQLKENNSKPLTGEIRGSGLQVLMLGDIEIMSLRKYYCSIAKQFSYPNQNEDKNNQ